MLPKEEWSYSNCGTPFPPSQHNARQKIFLAHSFYQGKREIETVIQLPQCILRCFPGSPLCFPLEHLGKWHHQTMQGQVETTKGDRGHSNQQVDLGNTFTFLPIVAPDERYQPVSKPTHKTELVTFRSMVGISSQLESLDSQSLCPDSEPTLTILLKQGNSHLHALERRRQTSLTQEAKRRCTQPSFKNPT